jgi:hypothetical protein
MKSVVPRENGEKLGQLGPPEYEFIPDCDF